MFGINIWIKGFLAILGSAFFGLMCASIANAANSEQVPVEIEFVNSITITENNPLEFGILDVNMANLEIVRVRPNGSVVDNNNNILGGTQAPASLTVGAQASKPITILIENISNGTGYTLVRWRCRYNGATDDSNCAGAGYTETSAASATLTIGVDLEGNGSAVVGVDNGAFDVTIYYQ